MWGFMSRHQQYKRSISRLCLHEHCMRVWSWRQYWDRTGTAVGGPRRRESRKCKCMSLSSTWNGTPVFIRLQNHFPPVAPLALMPHIHAGRLPIFISLGDYLLEILSNQGNLCQRRGGVGGRGRRRRCRSATPSNFTALADWALQPVPRPLIAKAGWLSKQEMTQSQPSSNFPFGGLACA